jgi:integrase
MEVVRPEFRVDVFYLPRDSPVFLYGECRVPGCTTAYSYSQREMCISHYVRYRKAHAKPGFPGLEAWVVAEAELVLSRDAPPTACGIDGCERGTMSGSLCRRHFGFWERQRSPDLENWMATFPYVAPTRGRRAEEPCRYPACPRWTDGGARVFCRDHYYRWRRRGSPDPEIWIEELSHGHDPRVKLGGLGRQVKLELQFGLQARYDEGKQRTAINLVAQGVKWVRESGITSLLDWDEATWRAYVATRWQEKRGVIVLRFLLDTRWRLEALLIGDDPWAHQFPLDVWDLRFLGLAVPHVRHLPFTGIPLPWLRELAKRWVRWRLATEINPTTIRNNLRALESFGEHLAAVAGPHAQPGDATRERIEAWLAHIAVTEPPSKRLGFVHSLSPFLLDVRRHAWVDGLPTNAFVFREDFPGRRPSKPRWIPELLMKQMETPGNLALFPSDDGRRVLQILMACGLRLKDARQLPFDCVVRDADGAPYLVWTNHKIKERLAFFPISQDLAEVITEQQRQVLQRFPDGCRWLFPGHMTNLNGSRPLSDQYWRNHLAEWLDRIQLADEHGQPARVTPHQFRHTLGTRLINADVPQHVVQQLLDHMSPQMTAVYARLLDKTVRTHWERATKINSEGAAVQLDPEHPLADAAWM